ncbi:3-phosphoshikimate 1-carboxyvinyltransferase [Lentilactobacillus sp. Marseille-Q4993]|uniref:3-phosphoshikimate 1-carboxyvinyltransferase n=1 Tax=Lentilactobacillus sp. Marseille-Q4993 TaxID=3039492 RepID=UPI0024BD0D7C|nr:3-phosphoshikimate 1-carboxyvinyltransferase [Lentilactobacillus sp. Marseille-Q4993]
MRKLISSISTGVQGTIEVPGDKSISHRSVMFGAISHGTTVAHHFLMSDDCKSTIRAFRDMGVAIAVSNDTVTIKGAGFAGLKQPSHELDMGNSGTTTRLMMGILSGLPFTTKLIGDDSLSKRPMKRVSEPLATMGATISTTNGHLPATVTGTKLNAVSYQLQTASAQVKSAMILAALQADGPSTITEKLPTRNHTEIMLRAFGADVKTASDQLTITVEPNPELHGIELTVPGDISSAAYFLAAGLIVPNSKVTLKGVGVNPTRTGLLKVIQRMGGNIAFSNQDDKTEPIADITVSTSALQPIEVTEAEIPSMVDELPVVALLCACANGVSHITGASELRVKETDRIAVITEEFKKLGIAIEELPDGFVIDGTKPWHATGESLDSHGDHRVGMVLAIAALIADKDMTLIGDESVAISYPNFFEDLASLVRG